MDRLETGTILKGGKHPYTITKVLGQGGFGITYKATWEHYDGNIKQKSYYAIKEFFPSDICHRQADGTVACKDADKDYEFKELKKDFLCEARLLRDKCRHKDIVPINEVFESSGTAYYVMHRRNNYSRLRGTYGANLCQDNPGCRRGSAIPA